MNKKVFFLNFFSFGLRLSYNLVTAVLDAEVDTVVVKKKKKKERSMTYV